MDPLLTEPLLTGLLLSVHMIACNEVTVKLQCESRVVLSNVKQAILLK